MRRSSILAISASRSTARGSKARVITVRRAPPAAYHASMAAGRSGRGRQSARRDGKPRQRFGHFDDIDRIGDDPEASPRSVIPATKPGTGAASNTSRTGSGRPPIESGWISHDGRPAARLGQISSMCAPRKADRPDRGGSGALHERRPTRQPARHHLERRTSTALFQSPSAPNPIAVGHQLLERRSPGPPQAAEVLERVSEYPLLVLGNPQPHLDPRRLAELLAPCAIAPESARPQSHHRRPARPRPPCRAPRTARSGCSRKTRRRMK